MSADTIGSAVQAAMGLAWFVQFIRFEPIMKWAFLSKDMQTSIDTHVAAYTNEERDRKMLDFSGSTR
jgi:hypothetical protein